MTVTWHEEEGVWSGGTSSEFMLAVAGSQEMVATLLEREREPYYVSSCGNVPYPHWHSGYKLSSEWDKENRHLVRPREVPACKHWGASGACDDSCPKEDK